MPLRKVNSGLFGEPHRSYLRERRMMRRVFKSSLMSNTKWRKLFLSIERLNLALPVCKIKWIDVDTPQIRSTPGSKFLYPPRPFVIAHEFGPYALCSIEWLEFPRVATQGGYGRNKDAGKTYNQDVDRAEKALQAIARFPMENTPDGLRIIEHVR